MSELHVRALVAGVFFGVWPLLMNRSGLSGNVSAAAFSLGVMVIVLPFALYEMKATNINANWGMVFLACIGGGLGLVTFNGMLSKATPQTVGSLFVLMILVQIATPTLYQILSGSGLTVSKVFGFAAAILAAFLLA